MMVPPRLMSPITNICDCTGQARAAEHSEMKLANVNDWGTSAF
jgi:hypothetical protein